MPCATPWASKARLSRRFCAALRFGGLEAFAVDLFADLGCDQGQDVCGEAGQGDGVEVGCVPDQRLLSLRQQGGVEVVGEVLQRGR